MKKNSTKVAAILLRLSLFGTVPALAAEKETYNLSCKEAVPKCNGFDPNSPITNNYACPTPDPNGQYNCNCTATNNDKNGLTDFKSFSVPNLTPAACNSLNSQEKLAKKVYKALDGSANSPQVKMSTTKLQKIVDKFFKKATGSLEE